MIKRAQALASTSDVLSHGNEEWDLIIEPNSSWFAVNIADLWRYRDLVLLFIKRDFTAQYKQTILGPLWHFIQPVLTTIMFLMVFGKIANIPTDGIDPILFYMSGITIWNYFASCLSNTSNTFVANAAIFGKVYFPRLIIPLSVVISNVVKFGIQFILLLSVMGYSYFFRNISFVINFSWLLIPVVLLIMAGLGLGLGMIISSLTTKYRDLALLIGFGVQLLMYATPVAYPLSFLKGKSYVWIAKINPLTGVVEAFKYALFHKSTLDISSLIYSIIFMLGTLFTGLILFSRVEKNFMDTV